MKHKRLILGIILIFMLFSLMLYYNLEHNNHDPETQYILNHFEQFNTTKVCLSGQVKNVDKTNNTILIQVNQTPQGIILASTTESLNTTQPGDIVEVYGVLTSRNSITAEKLLIYQRWKYDLIYIRSLPAIPFVLYLFFRTYSFNLDTFRFERRKKHA
jgi:hypothetical protein